MTIASTSNSLYHAARAAAPALQRGGYGALAILATGLSLGCASSALVLGIGCVKCVNQWKKIEGTTVERICTFAELFFMGLFFVSAGGALGYTGWMLGKAALLGNSVQGFGTILKLGAAAMGFLTATTITSRMNSLDAGMYLWGQGELALKQVGIPVVTNMYARLEKEYQIKQGRM